MKKLLSLAVLCAFSASAEIIVYTQAFTSKTTGAGAVTTTNFTGWLLYDTDTSEVLDIVVNSKAKTFHAPDTSTASVAVLSSGLNAWSLYAWVPVNDFGGANLLGNASNFTLGTTNKFWAPKTAAATGTIFYDYGGPAFNKVEQITGSISYDAKTTTAANKNGTDLTTEFDLLKNALVAKGFTEY
jgi:hypothetical protein